LKKRNIEEYGREVLKGGGSLSGAALRNFGEWGGARKNNGDEGNRIKTQEQKMERYLHKKKPQLSNKDKSRIASEGVLLSRGQEKELDRLKQYADRQGNKLTRKTQIQFARKKIRKKHLGGRRQKQPEQKKVNLSEGEKKCLRQTRKTLDKHVTSLIKIAHKRQGKVTGSGKRENRPGAVDAAQVEKTETGDVMWNKEAIIRNTSSHECRIKTNERLRKGTNGSLAGKRVFALEKRANRAALKLKNPSQPGEGEELKRSPGQVGRREKRGKKGRGLQ